MINTSVNPTLSSLSEIKELLTLVLSWSKWHKPFQRTKISNSRGTKFPLRDILFFYVFFYLFGWGRAAPNFHFILKLFLFSNLGNSSLEARTLCTMSSRSFWLIALVAVSLTNLMTRSTFWLWQGNSYTSSGTLRSSDIRYLASSEYPDKISGSVVFAWKFSS